MLNRTLEVKHPRGWIKYLAVPAAALLLAACSSGLNADVPTTQDELAPQANSCLNWKGKKVKPRSGGRVGIFRESRVIVDARGKTFQSKVPLVGNYNRGFLCIVGGTYTTSLGVSASWHSAHNTGGMYFAKSPRVTIEGVALGVGGRIVGDGISMKQDTDRWVFKDSYIGRSGDDAIEADRFSPGVVDDILVDSTFTGISVRREKNSYTKAHYYTVTVKNSLISMKNGNDLFKVTRSGKGPGRGKNYARLSLKNNVFYIPKRDAGDIDRKVFNGGKCQNNTIVYTGGSKSYLEYLKRNSPKCMRVTTDKRVWDRARANWFKRHPQFSKYR